MEVLDLIYLQYFFTANSLQHQATTSHYFQPLTPLTLVLAAADIHFSLSEYASWKQATVMFSQYEYRGKFCPFPVIYVSLEATALIYHALVGRLIPTLQCNSVMIGTPQFPSALLSLDWCSSDSFCTQSHYIHAPQFPLVHLNLECCCYIAICILYPTSPSLFDTSILVRALPNPCQQSSA